MLEGGNSPEGTAGDKERFTSSGCACGLSRWDSLEVSGSLGARPGKYLSESHPRAEACAGA